uniref:DUF148 domain-containing protein n=1 Tax=Panagrellus redivivus TaxID=6233 RepID=A0A7E4VA88_PANRE
MFKILIVCSVLFTATAQVIGGCNVTDLVTEGKAIYNEIPPTQLAQVKSIISEAYASNTTMTKGQFLTQLENVANTLSANLQTQIRNFVPTSLPQIPSTLSSAAQTTGNQIESILSNMTITMPQNDAQIRQIIQNTNPSVLAELKTIKVFPNC